MAGKRFAIGQQSPVQSAVQAFENTAVAAFINAAGVQTVAKTGDLSQAVVREPLIYAGKSLAGIRALQYSGILSCEIENTGVHWIKHHPVHLFGAQMQPGMAGVRGFEQSKSGS